MTVETRRFGARSVAAHAACPFCGWRAIVAGPRASSALAEQELQRHLGTQHRPSDRDCSTHVGA
jgi:hypothetical protein